MSAEVVPLRTRTFEPWVNKAQVAAYLGRSRRWSS